MSTAAAPGKVYTTGFWLMCLSSFLFFLSFNLLIPELPAHLTSLGGGEYKGYIIALFTVTAALSRPFSGKLADTVGRIPVMVIGTLVCFVCGFLYAWATTVFTFLALRLLHGFSTGFKPTGTAAFIADIIPVERRGEAMGLLGVCGTLGMAVGPALCGPITEYFSINVLFYVSSGLALLSVLVQGTMTETLNPAQRQKFHWGLLRIEWHEVLEPRVLKPAVVTLLCLFPYGAIVTIVPDQSQLLGLTGLTKGSFFICYTISTLAVRLVAGRASDIYGRVPVLRLSSLALVLALVVLTLARTPLVFLIGAVLFGLASGLNSPTLYAWTVDLSHPEHRGRAVGTMYIALEVGIMFGALLAGWVYSNDATRLPWVYALSAACVLGALVYLYRQPVQRPAAG